MNWTPIILLSGYILVFFLTIVIAIWWSRRVRRTRRPLPENYKLLRMPGEHLWRRVIESDQEGLKSFLLTMLVPLLVILAALQGTARLPKDGQLWGLIGTAAVFVVSIGFSVRWFIRRWSRNADDYLGFFGERYVAEFLEPLKSQGWHIFHDVPCEGATGKFNLDHVAVGAGGVWVVETKTRRKGKARPGFKDHEVVFDGQRLIWPWGENTDGLKQALDNARWLRDWLAKMTGEAVEVAAVLTFPGWCVIERKLGPVRVVNPKGLSSVLTSRNQSALSKGKINLFKRQLEERCRNVEY